ncbi:unnamed protein product [Leuciscus chuanchicus]
MPPDLLYPLSPYRSINRECMKANFSVVTAQQDLIEKEREKEELRHQQIQRHAEAVRQQVQEREVQAVSQRRELFREGERLEEAARSHRARLDEIKEKKLRELRQKREVKVRRLSCTAPAAKKPETVRIITKDLIRDLRQVEAKGGTASLASSEETPLIWLFSYQDAAEKRKAQMCQADLSRQKNQKVRKLEIEARDRYYEALFLRR